MQERRDSPRQNCGLAVKFKLETDKDWRKGFVTDVSNRGVQLLTLNPVENKSIITLTLIKQNGLPEQTWQGEVRWVSSHDKEESGAGSGIPSMGVQLTENIESSLDAINKAMQRVKFRTQLQYRSTQLR